MFGMLSALICNFFCLFLKVCDNETYPPPLSAEREKECFEKMKNGDMNARAELIEHNLRLVAHIVKRYYTAAKDRDDLISIGTVGLIKAVDSFNYSNGTRFATYASKCLQNEILMYFRASRKLKYEVSINEAIDSDTEGNPLSYIDVLSVPDTVAEDIDTKTQIQKMLRLIESGLDEREKQIIKLRYGLTGARPKTQRETAEIMGISRSYVSRIEKSVLERMKALLT